jgi:hypothetical protein
VARDVVTPNLDGLEVFPHLFGTSLKIPSIRFPGGAHHLSTPQLRFPLLPLTDFAEWVFDCRSSGNVLLGRNRVGSEDEQANDRRKS